MNFIQYNNMNKVTKYFWPLPRGSIPNDFTEIEKKYYQPYHRIPELSLKNNYLYHIRARNSCLGIYNYDNRCFTIARTKFGQTFLFDEYDFNTGRPYGTVVPFREIEVSPLFENDTKKLDYLLEWGEKLKNNSLD